MNERLLAELPAVSASAAPEVAAAAAAVSAARIAAEQEQQQQQGGVVGGSAAGEAVFQAQQQPDVRLDSGFGGASQAAIFRKLDAAADTVAAAADAAGVGKHAADRGGVEGAALLLRVVWGPQFASMTVGEVAGGPDGGGEAAAVDDVPVEHF
jgi:hypothetical protein